MNSSRTASVLLRGLALGLALVAVVGRDSSAKVAMVQAPPVILVPNLVSYWAADTDTGTTANDSAGSNPGTYSPVANPATTSASILSPVPTGNTRSFNLVSASNQFINVPDSASLTLGGAFTLAAWVRRTSTTGNQMGIIEKYDDSPAIANGYSLRLQNNADAWISFSIRNGTTSKGISTAGSQPSRGVPVNTWAHVAGVYNPTTTPHMAIYKDATKDPTDSASAGQEPVLPPTDGANVLQIGKDYGANAFNGNIDEVRIYNRALTQPELQILHDGQPATGTLFVSPGPGMNQLTWSAPPGAPAGITYSILSGPATGNYTSVVNGITTTAYDDLAAAPGVPTFYVVVAVTVMASPYSNEVSGIPGPAGPPPPPPPPRTSQVGGEENPCGCGSTSAPGGWTLLLGLVLLLGALIPTLTRRI